MFVLPILDYTKVIVRSILQPGDIAIDGTAGNGYDTLFLAQLVGSTGRVYAFDIQAVALASTRTRLMAADALAQVTLIEADHATLATHTPPPPALSVAMFNLGYLPGGDKQVITRPASTLRALQAAFELLRPGGLLTVVVYPGHAGGEDEAAAVVQWARGLPPEQAQSGWYQLLHPRQPAPSLVFVEKRAP